MRRDRNLSLHKQNRHRAGSRRHSNKDWFSDMNEMTSLLISSVAAAFVAGAMAIPITMPDAAFAATKPKQGEEVCPAPAPEELAETDGEITVQPVHVRPNEDLQPDLPRPGICVLRIGLSDTRCCPD